MVALGLVTTEHLEGKGAHGGRPGWARPERGAMARGAGGARERIPFWDVCPKCRGCEHRERASLPAPPASGAAHTTLQNWREALLMRLVIVLMIFYK